MVSKQPEIRRIPSDGSTRSAATKKNNTVACRHIETLFPSMLANGSDKLKSVHGDHFFLSAQIIYEGRTGCADKPVRKWQVPRGDDAK